MPIYHAMLVGWSCPMLCIPKVWSCVFLTNSRDVCPPAHLQSDFDLSQNPAHKKVRFRNDFEWMRCVFWANEVGIARLQRAFGLHWSSTNSPKGSHDSPGLHNPIPPVLEDPAWIMTFPSAPLVLDAARGAAAILKGNLSEPQHSHLWGSLAMVT